MKHLSIVFALVLALFAGGCVHVPSAIDKTFIVNKATYGVLSKHYKVKCRQLAAKCVKAEDKQCKPARDCLASFEKAMQISSLIDTKLYIARTSYDAVDGGVEAEKILKEALALVIQLEKIVQDLQLKKLLEK